MLLKAIFAELEGQREGIRKKMAIFAWQWNLQEEFEQELSRLRSSLSPVTSEDSRNYRRQIEVCFFIHICVFCNPLEPCTELGIAGYKIGRVGMRVFCYFFTFIHAYFLCTLHDTGQLAKCVKEVRTVVALSVNSPLVCWKASNQLLTV